MKFEHLETIEIGLCTDCVLFIANGDLPEEDHDADGTPLEVTLADRIAVAWPVEDDGRFHLIVGSADDGDDEAYFSWRECDGCGSSLGGDRCPGVALFHRDAATVSS